MKKKRIVNIILLLTIGIVLTVLVINKRDDNAYATIKKDRKESDCREFLSKFPDSEHAPSVRQILEEIEYQDYSLPNDSQPYKEYYGSNYSYSYGRPSIKVKASNSSDVLVIVRFDNSQGEVAGHSYIRKGCSSSIYVPADRTYQVFFYYGTGWYPKKEMANGIRGGFLMNESYSKDGSPMRLEWGESVTYTLTQVVHGNFSTSHSNKNEFF